jgi:hypothetical protein
MRQGTARNSFAYRAKISESTWCPKKNQIPYQSFESCYSTFETLLLQPLIQKDGGIGPAEVLATRCSAARC